MKRIQLYLLAVMSLFTAIPSYSFGFFGVEVSGTLDEVTEKLKPIGFSPVTVVPKIGEFAGQEVIFGNDSLRALKGQLLGFQVILHLSTDKKSEVDIATIEYRKNDSKSENKFAGDLLKYLGDKYADPEPLIFKEVLSGDELIKFQNSYDGNAPDVVGVWEFKNLIIIYSTYFSTGLVECSFCKK